jgi:cation diffusion facilitator CzcD-associated flavoprotein CzcO
MMAKTATQTTNAPLKLDAAVIGAGVAGLYELHLLRRDST